MICRYKNQRGFTLTELLITLVILSIGVLGFVSSFANISKAVQSSKNRSIATNLAQEKIESLKNTSYYRLIPTTAPLTAAVAVGGFQYDGGFYPEETLNIAGIPFTRRVFVEKCSVNTSVPTSISYLNEDTGIKRVKVYILWREAGEWKVIQVQNMLANPVMRQQNATVSGNVQSTTSVNLNGALVAILENSSYFDTTDVSGNYSFTLVPGSYTLRASQQGYFAPMQDFYVAEGNTYTWNPDLNKMSSGTITGTAYFRDHLVISQVVGSTQSAGVDQEYVELYNPTTATVNMSSIDLYIDPEGSGGSDDPAVVPLTMLNLTIPPSGYYLIANISTVSAMGVLRNADAVYVSTGANLIEVKEDPGSQASGGVGIANSGAGSWTTAAWIDRVGWIRTGQDPQLLEGTAIVQGIGLEREEQFVRITSTGGVTSGQGRAYDSNDNSQDFATDGRKPFLYQPRNTSDVEGPVTGTPAVGAYVSADDGLSGVVQCNSLGNFTLMSVATGTWTVALSSGSSFLEISTSITQSGQTVSAGNLFLSSTTTDGFVTGIIYRADNNLPVSGIFVSGLGATPDDTDPNGRYKLTGSSGTAMVVANANNLNSSFVSMSITTEVYSGRYTTGVDMFLTSGGRITGQIKISNNPLPGVPVIASTSTGITSGEAVTDANGLFSIRNLSTGSYTITPQLDQGETYTPSAPTVSIATPGQSVFSATFTVSNAMGFITGALTNSGENIQTGVLLVVTTATIAGDPPEITSTLRAAPLKYYAASSLADGTYSISIPGGNPGTPITYNVYGWYADTAGGTAAKKSTTAAVTGGQTTTGANLSWP